MMLFLNVMYVLIAIAMIALILLQRGAGAQAGSGFGGGASSTVFGARGAASFLTKSTRWLAIAFFGISLYMAWYASHGGKPKAGAEQDLGVVSSSAAPKPATLPTAPAQSAPTPALPTAPAQSAPVAPAPSTPAPSIQPAAKPAPEKPAQQGG